MASFVSLVQQQRQERLVTTSGESTILGTLRLCRGKSLLSSKELTEHGNVMAENLLGKCPEGYGYKILVSEGFDIYVSILPTRREQPLLQPARSITLAYGLQAFDLESLDPGEIAFGGDTAEDRFKAGVITLEITNNNEELAVVFTAA